MAAVTICSDLGAQKNKVCYCFHSFPIYFPWSDGTGSMILVFWMLSFKPTFPLSSFTFIKRLFSSSLLFAIRVGVIYVSEVIDNSPSYLDSCPCGSIAKETACNAGDLGSIPGLGRSPGKGNGYPLQYSGLENSMDCNSWGHKESDMTERLSLHLLQSWFQLVLHPAQHFTWCNLHIS